MKRMRGPSPTRPRLSARPCRSVARVHLRPATKVPSGSGPRTRLFCIGFVGRIADGRRPSWFILRPCRYPFAPPLQPIARPASASLSHNSSSMTCLPIRSASAEAWTSRSYRIRRLGYCWRRSTEWPSASSSPTRSSASKNTATRCGLRSLTLSQRLAAGASPPPSSIHRRGRSAQGCTRGRARGRTHPGRRVRPLSKTRFSRSAPAADDLGPVAAFRASLRRSHEGDRPKRAKRN